MFISFFRGEKVSDVTVKALDHCIRSANKAKAKSSWVS